MQKEYEKGIRSNDHFMQAKIRRKKDRKRCVEIETHYHLNRN